MVSTIIQLLLSPNYACPPSNYHASACMLRYIIIFLYIISKLWEKEFITTS